MYNLSTVWRFVCLCAKEVMMRTNGTLVHPEVMEFMNICAISPDGSRSICDLIQNMSNDNSKDNKEVKNKSKHKKKKKIITR